MADKITIELVEQPTKRLQRHLLDAKYFLLGLTSSWFVSRDDSRSIDQLKVFCCFVGHGRSGGTLVGALLNAHPNIVMSNELNALRRLRLGLTGHQLFRLIFLVSMRQVRRGSKGGGGYTYAVPNQWQGKHAQFVVIGDRKAGATALEVLENPQLLSLLDRKITIGKRFVHVVRNPFDTIATTYRKTLAHRGEALETHLSREIRNYFARCTAVRTVELVFGSNSIHYLHQERLIAEPLRELTSLCNFLGVEALPDYLNDCAQIVMKSPHETRSSVEWPNDQLDTVTRQMKEFHWLRRYEPKS